MLLDPLSYDAISFKEKATQEWNINLDEAERLSYMYSIDTMEKPPADEVAFLYYLNLNDERQFNVMHPINYYSTSLDKQKNDSGKKVKEDIYSIEPGIPLSPKRRLLNSSHR